MGYAYSKLDTKLQNWFKTDDSCSTLHRVLLKGRMRSLKNIDIEFDYPISVFAGKNGCGKTTALALAACAYHNMPKGFKLKSRKRNYYTFSDFFIQTQEEIKHGDINIRYKFLHNNWKGVIPGMAYQSISKRKGGKWSKYGNRIRKAVLYLGIERVVPQTEKQVFKSYIKYFIDGVDDGWYGDVMKNVGCVLGKNYTDFKNKNVGAYTLQLVKEMGVTYSGFNMGAGEKALFELFSIIHECSGTNMPTLLIIDEIELGLHEVAQRKLMQVLKEICQKHKLQIICTTHSPAILESLPPDARFYVEKDGDDTVLTKGISGAFAAGRLNEQHTNELDIYIEDQIGVSLLSAFFDVELRQRVQLIPVGSFGAVCRQLGAAYRHPNLKNKSIAIIDGDQRAKLQDFEVKIMGYLELTTDAEKTKFKEWIKDRIFFLPGNQNPEKWIISKSIEYADKSLANQFGIKVNSLKQELSISFSQPVHDEIYYFANKIVLSEDRVLNDLCRFIATKETTELKKLKIVIEGFLSRNI